MAISAALLEKSVEEDEAESESASSGLEAAGDSSFMVSYLASAECAPMEVLWSHCDWICRLILARRPPSPPPPLSFSSPLPTSSLMVLDLFS